MSISYGEQIIKTKTYLKNEKSHKNYIIDFIQYQKIYIIWIQINNLFIYYPSIPIEFLSFKFLL